MYPNAGVPEVHPAPRPSRTASERTSHGRLNVIKSHLYKRLLFWGLEEFEIHQVTMRNKSSERSCCLIRRPATSRTRFVFINLVHRPRTGNTPYLPVSANQNNVPLPSRRAGSPPAGSPPQDPPAEGPGTRKHADREEAMPGGRVIYVPGEGVRRAPRRKTTWREGTSLNSEPGIG